MKNKLSFIGKLRIIWYLLFQHHAGVIVKCHYCGSSEVEFNKETIHIEDNKYYSAYTCTKCGATCNNKEVWHQVE